MQIYIEGMVERKTKKRKKKEKRREEKPVFFLRFALPL